MVERVVEMMLQEPPGEATYWSSRTMAAASGVSGNSVRGIWRDVIGFSREEAAAPLDLSVDNIKNYELGPRGGKPYPVRRTVAFTCVALYHRIEPWTLER